MNIGLTVHNNVIFLTTVQFWNLSFEGIEMFKLP